MDGLPFCIEHAGHRHPAEVPLKSGAPDHRRDAARGRVQRADRHRWQAWRNGLRRVSLRWRRVDSSATYVVVDLALDVGRSLIREADVLLDVISEGETVTISTGKAPEQYDTLCAEGLQADRVNRSQQRPTRDTPGRIDQLVPRHVHEPALQQPCRDVLPSVSAREPAD